MMNRIKSFSSGVTDAPGISRTSPGAALLEPDLADDGFALFTPLHYEPNYAYPLIVWLHGCGENERVVSRVMTHVSMRNYVAVAPRGTMPRGTMPNAASAGPADAVAGSTAGLAWLQSDEHIELAHVRVAAAIDRALSQWNVHRQRIFLAGAGCGGTMALRIALRQPCRFAGALSIDGAFPRGGAPLMRLSEARQMPLFIGSGRLSETYPATDVCDDLRLLYAAGMSVTLKQYPGSSPCRPQVLRDVDHWIMELLAEQKKAAVVSAGRRQS